MRECIVCLVSALSLFLCGCRSKYIEVPVPVDKIQYVDRYINRTDSFTRMDSVYFHDSISVYARGDTVFLDKWHYKDRIKLVNTKSKDTVLVTKIDSIPKIVYKYIEKVSSPSKSLIIKEVSASIFLAVLFVAVLFLLAKIKKK